MKHTALALALAFVAGCDPERFVFDEDAGAPSTPPQTASCGPDGGACPLSNLHCDPGSQQCVECVEDSDCVTAAAPVCDYALHQCVQCGSDLNCSSGQMCEPLTRQCLTLCPDGGSCPYSAPFCTRGICLTCARNSDCADMGTGGGAAQWTCSEFTGRCVECSNDQQCTWPTKRCDVPLSRCVECVTSSDCPAARPVCDPGAHQCVLP